jgi:uncharacterized protein with ATP-grasp and redox domains
VKVGTRCGYCLLYRGYQIIKKATKDEETQFKAMEKLLQFLGENYNSEAVPSILGTGRDRIIREITGCQDPYTHLKKVSNEEALNLLPRMEELLKRTPKKKKLGVACKIACMGNVIEYDVPDHKSDINRVLEMLDEVFYIDDTDRLGRFARGGGRLLYLTDNAGEIVFDRLLVRELTELGYQVTVGVKGGPSLNDALIEDAEEVGMIHECEEVISTGTDAIGINLDEASSNFKNHFFNSDIILAKGMANWETLSEIPAPCPLMYLFRSKCEPVAQSVEAPLNRCIAKMVNVGWSLNNLLK